MLISEFETFYNLPQKFMNAALKHENTNVDRFQHGDGEMSWHYAFLNSTLYCFSETLFFMVYYVITAYVKWHTHKNKREKQ